MTVPPYEWPTRMAGLLTRPSARLTAATSPWTVSRQFWVDSTSCPSACSVGISLLKHEPSAHSPWANTMLGLFCLLIVTPSAGVWCRSSRARQQPAQQRVCRCQAVEVWSLDAQRRDEFSECAEMSAGTAGGYGLSESGEA